MKKYWLGFAAVIVLSFIVLGWVGVRIYQQAPPIAERVVTTDGTVMIPAGDISTGQNVWQAMGGMEVGSVWGHGSYVAPDWTADWLHRELVFILNEWAQSSFGKSYDALDGEHRAQLHARLESMIRKNTYDPATKTITVDSVRLRAFEANLAHYTDVFTNGKKEYAIQKNSISNPVKLRQFAAFIFWSSWAASTNRPDDNITYTSNWPHETLIGNIPTGDAVVWTGVSIIVLLAGIGAMAWFYASRKEEEMLGDVPVSDPLLNAISTPSQRATLKYFWTVLGLLLLQMGMGIVSAHYGVEGDGFYGIPLAEILPYSVARTWHTQLGIFWIATAWLAAGLFIGPAVSGVEPKFQRLGVNVLFGALLVVVLGSMAGEWLSVMHHLPDNLWYYFGHSGFEYIDLGKFFQIALLVGLVLWFVLMYRAIRPALQRKDEQKPILTLFLISSGAIASFYGAALMVGKHTNLAVAEYWRWWVVHLWVEGFFEVFATVVIAFLFSRLKLISLKTAGEATVLSATIFLSGGIIGTLHHLYFSGTPTIVLALGSVFSALEVVPLVFVGYEAWENIKLSRAKEWVQNYKWPIYFFVAVAFWNLVGAGLFGFMINPPVALYYMQGLNTTPVHAHAALFGVYGMLGIGLLLFCLRAMNPKLNWDNNVIKFSFWSMNIGLMAMVVLSLLPVGLMQTWASVEYGYWYARSAEFLQTDTMHMLRWTRVFGDTIFASGIVALVFFVGQITLKGLKK
ncbi:MAG: nitric-oxide reductase large subunit [Bacteroidota bacterium]